MKRPIMAAIMMALVAAAFSTIPAAAATFDGKPKMLLHVKSTTSKNQCNFGSLTDCQTAILKEGLSGPTGPFYFIYALLANGDLASGSTGVEFGITYQDGNTGGDVDGVGIDIFGWTLCGTLEFPQPSPVWPKPGGGTLVTWTPCRTGETSVIGYFYSAAYGADKMGLIPRPITGFIKATDCNTAERVMDPGDLGHVAFSAGATTDGCNSCIQICPPVAVEETTWGGIKGMFSR
jgi:hypothetical protein